MGWFDIDQTIFRPTGFIFKCDVSHYRRRGNSSTLDKEERNFLNLPLRLNYVIRAWKKVIKLSEFMQSPEGVG